MFRKKKEERKKEYGRAREQEAFDTSIEETVKGLANQVNILCNQMVRQRSRMSDADIARILVEEQCFYNIITCPFPQTIMDLSAPDEERQIIMGLVDDNNKQIYLWDGMNLEEKRLTIIHEALHTHAYLNCLNWSEREVDRRSREIFRQLYGFRARV